MAALETAIFGAGCFWGIESAFRKIKGVADVEVGYCGGTLAEATYEQVYSGTTGHAEVVVVTFDPKKVSFDTLLNTFWTCHDPTQLNRQGPDVGTQYRSVIFPTTPEQEAAARLSREAMENAGRWSRPIATTIEEPNLYSRAEDYHQRYLEKRGYAFCH